MGSVPPTMVKFNPLFSQILSKVFLSRNMHLDQMIKNIVVLTLTSSYDLESNNAVEPPLTTTSLQ